VIFGVLTTVTMKITGIRGLALCSVVDKYGRVGGKCCVHFQSVLTLKMGAAGFSEVSEFACRSALRTGS
jgi:hypothetical protein